jgi:hypothetical protein
VLRNGSISPSPCGSPEVTRTVDFSKHIVGPPAHAVMLVDMT